MQFDHEEHTIRGAFIRAGFDFQDGVIMYYPVNLHNRGVCGNVTLLAGRDPIVLDSWTELVNLPMRWESIDLKTFPVVAFDTEGFYYFTKDKKNILLRKLYRNTFKRKTWILGNIDDTKEPKK
jgi:hypothetical protein